MKSKNITIRANYKINNSGCRGGLPTGPGLITPASTEASAKMFHVSLETDWGLLSQLVKFY